MALAPRGWGVLARTYANQLGTIGWELRGEIDRLDGTLGFDVPTIFVACPQRDGDPSSGSHVGGKKRAAVSSAGD